MAQKIKIKRSTQVQAPVSGSLEHGELATSYINLGNGTTRTSLFVGNPDDTTNTALISNAEQLNDLLTKTSTTGGFVKGVATSDGKYSSAFFIVNENTDPSFTHSELLGFVKGSLWFNNVSKNLWSAESVAAGAAVWNLVSAPLNAPLTYKGVIDASANPNYPAAQPGDLYVVSVSGKIGGVSGQSVESADQILCVTATSGGDEVAAGAAFNIVQANIATAVTSTSLTSTVNNIAVFDGINGRVIKDSGKQFSVTSVASTLVDRDINKRIAINGIIPDVNMVTAAGVQTVTLTNASDRFVSFANTITAGQSNITRLPNATTLMLGDEFSFYNGTAGLLTIQEADGVVKNILTAGESITLKLVNNTTAYGIWKYVREEASFDIIDGGIF